jgi:hypothetical protein
VLYDPLEQPHGAVHALLEQVVHGPHPVQLRDELFEFHHSLSDIILINLMCHMIFLSKSIVLSMLSLDMMHMDLTWNNSNDLLKFHYSISDIILINLMCHMNDPI